MASIILPGRFTWQPQGWVEVSPDWADSLKGIHTPFGPVIAYGANAKVESYTKGRGFTSAGVGQGAKVSDTRTLAGLDNATVFAAFTRQGATSASGAGRALYTERSDSTQIYKLSIANNSLIASYGVSFVFRNSASQLINSVTTVPLDLSRDLNTAAFVTDGSAKRTIYGDGVGATNTTNYANSFTTANDCRVCGDASDTNSFYNGGVYYVALWARSLSSAEIVELTRNPWQIFKKPGRVLYFDVASGGATTHNLEAAAAAQAAAAAALSVSVPLAGAGISVATASGAVSVSVNSSGNATAQANATGGLSLSIPLSGSAVAQALAAAGLSQAVPLSGAAAAGAAASGAISINVSLSGAAIADAAASAGLTVESAGSVDLAGNAAATAAASASLTQSIPLTGAALTVSGASGALTQIVALYGAAAAASMATGGLDVAVNLSGEALAAALAAAGLTVGAGGLSAAAAAEASASGTVTLRVNLDGAAVAQAIAAGALTTDGLIVAGTPGWSVSSPARNWSVSSPARNWSIAS